MKRSDWKQEQAYLEQVKEKLEENIRELEPDVDRLGSQTAEIRKHFWEEVTVNTASQEDFEETFHSIRQQEALLSERERSYRLRLRQWKNMNRLLASPYFGRIDFREDGESFDEKIYIGVASFADEDGMSFLVYDWRTPIAGMYYDYSTGKAAFHAPGGEITGTIQLKRQYQIANGQLKNVFDTSLTIGDELLQQVLGKGADSQMRSIVATIQKEQNAIIRDDTSRMVLVDGVAGSGKTSAALQRVAYLLYKNRERLKADQIVLFSPNPVFNSYVSAVLPELGEENMQQATFQEYLEHALGKEWALEDPFDQMEVVLTGSGTEGYEARVEGMAYKASAAFLRALQSYGLWLNREGMQFNSIRFRGRELITEDELRSQFYSYDPAIRLTNRVTLLQEWLLRQLTLLERQERDEVWVGEELNYLDKEQYAAAFGRLHRAGGVFDFAEAYEAVHEKQQNITWGEEDDFDFAEREEDILRQAVVKEHFRTLRKSVRRLSFINIRGVYAQLFSGREAFRSMTGETALPALWAEICAQTQARLDGGRLFYEDATPYLYVKELVEGVRTNTEVRHVFVDEGQDYSVFQYEFLAKLFPRARMTVLGDSSQAIFTQASELRGGGSPLVKLFGEADTRQFRLAKSYRSTREIAEFTKSLLPGGKEIETFHRSGKKPTLAQVESKEQLAARLRGDLAMLQAEGYSSVAVIAQTAAESEEAYRLLREQGNEDVKLVTKTSAEFAKGLLVIPAYLAKGVEFDAVIIYDASRRVYGEESRRKLFYTACTRAMHRLMLYSVGEWTPFLLETEVSLFEKG
ncbi:RNA polymerase recycling motor HelD [Paenibacillus sp. YN15]|uniref:RNA polymerase recycling motor HelD n=1 Tax=Paenibacillus sp. YN15 TaxID=1742774 RepID=UPI000DCC7157|nr:RNA polymerase recycling motor HelD [Paenibacillus sp. YN15]RAV01496.1 helicase [Paenibacillus sp. YN15]